MGATVPTNSSLGPDSYLFVEPERELRSQIGAVYGLSIAFLILCTVTVSLRVYTKVAILHTLRTDDWLFVATLVIFIAYGILLCVACSQLLLHVPEYAAGQVPTSLFLPRIVVAGYCLYSAVTILFKCAFGAFFLTLFSHRRAWRILIWIGMVVPGLLGLVNIIWTALRPCELETVFFAGLPACGSDAFRARTGWTAVAGLWAAATAATDVAYGALAFAAVRGLQLPPRARAVATALCCLGCAGGVASCVRLAFLIAQVPGLSVLGGALHVSVWSVVEPGMAITAAALASLRPLWMRCRDPAWHPAGFRRRSDRAGRWPGATGGSGRTGKTVDGTPAESDKTPVGRHELEPLSLVNSPVISDKPAMVTVSVRRGSH